MGPPRTATASRRAWSWAIALAALLATGQARALDPGRRVSQYVPRVYNEASGLPQSSVYAIAQTPDGFLWIGTDAGLARFDGVAFTVVDTGARKGIGHDQVRALLVDRAGALWAGLRGGAGLVRRRADGFESFAGRTGLVGTAVLSAFEDSRGALWFGGWRGLARLEGGRFTGLGEADGLPFGAVLAIAESADGAVWIGTASGLGRCHAARCARVAAAGLDGTRITALLVDGGTLWVGGSAGLYELDTRAGEARPRRWDRERGVPDGAVNVLYRDRDGNAWIGTDAGLLRKRGAAIERLAPASPGGDSFVSAFEDREGNLWLGTRAGGLVRLQNGKLVTLTAAEGLPSNLTTAVIEARDGALWIGTDGAGVARLDAAGTRSFTAAGGLCGDSVLTLFEDRGGAIWVGAMVGRRSNLCRIERDGSIRVFTEADGLARNEHARVVYQDRGGTLWIGTEQLLRLAGDRLVPEPLGRPIELPARNVFSIHEDRSGALWVGVGNGLWRRREGRWQEFRTTNTPLSANMVTAIAGDDDGTLWLATARGLSRYRDGAFAGYGEGRGLFDHTLSALVDDGAGHLWLGSPGGVFRVRKRDFDHHDGGRLAAIPFTRFGLADGMRTDQCNGLGSAAAARLRDGRLVFPTSKGLAIFTPGRVPMNALPPPVVLERLVVDGRALDARAGGQAPPGPRAVEAHYTAPSFTAPEKVRFRYRLEPFDAAWIDAGGRRAAYYTNVPPGAYRFRVIAANEDGVWNEQGAAVALELEPYFRETAGFKALLAAAVALLAFGIHRWRLGELEARHRAVLAERTRIAREMHDTLAQGFTGISLHLEAAVKKLPGEPARALGSLDRARLLVRASLAEARRAVWGLRPQALEAGDLPSALGEIVAKLGAEAPVRLNVAGAVRPLPAATEQELLRIAQEALTNALRHARASRITVDLTYAPAAVELEIRDDGVGFAATTDFAAVGRFGLAGVRERVAALGGELTLRSAAGEGTRITARFPLGGADDETPAARAGSEGGS